MRVSGKYLLDTNIIIDFFKGDKEIANHLRKEETMASSIVMGELYYGAYASGVTKNRERRIEQIAVFFLNSIPIEVDEATADFYGQIKSQLKSLGTPIPENDIWIAAQCMQHGLVLVTRDRHFANIQDLKSVPWQSS